MVSQGQLEENKKIYRRFIDILNTQKFDALSEVVNIKTYHEICVGFTTGKVDFANATASFKKVLKGIPNLRATIDTLTAEGNRVQAHLMVTGKQSGNLFGVPATNNVFNVHMFDYVIIEDGKIVDRIQQVDSFGEFIQLFKKRLMVISTLLLLVLVSLVIAVIKK